MNIARAGIAGVTAPMLLAGMLLAGGPAQAQAQAQAQAPAAQQNAQAQATAASQNAQDQTAAAPHPVHRRHRHHRRQAAVTTAPPAQSAAARVEAGSAPAPVPNEDAGPPRAPLDSSGNVTPGSMSIHYPPNGDGYLPGSSSSDMDNRTTPAVPGVQYQAPIANPAPQPLPPPDATH